MEKNYLKLIALLSVAGLLISGYLLYLKVSTVESFCNFTPEVSCDMVSQSPYSEFPPNSGIPIAGLGMINYLIFLFGALAYLKGESFLGIRKKQAFLLMFLWGAFNILFYVYLTYLELFVIYAICPLCVSTFAISILIFLLAYLNRKNFSTQTPSDTNAPRNVDKGA